MMEQNNLIRETQYFISKKVKPVSHLKGVMRNPRDKERIKRREYEGEKGFSFPLCSSPTCRAVDGSLFTGGSVG